jgi:hypothetical protein
MNLLQKLSPQHQQRTRAALRCSKPTKRPRQVPALNPPAATIGNIPRTHPEQRKHQERPRPELRAVRPRSSARVAPSPSLEEGCLFLARVSAHPHCANANQSLMSDKHESAGALEPLLSRTLHKLFRAGSSLSTPLFCRATRGGDHAHNYKTIRFWARGWCCRPGRAGYEHRERAELLHRCSWSARSRWPPASSALPGLGYRDYGYRPGYRAYGYDRVRPYGYGHNYGSAGCPYNYTVQDGVCKPYTGR